MKTKRFIEKHSDLIIAVCIYLLVLIFLFAAFMMAKTAIEKHDKMEQMPNEQAATRFSVVDSYGRFDVIVDLDTGVMYSISENGTMTVLLNWDGSPRCYPGFDAREDRP